MSIDFQTASVSDRQTHLYNVISSERFLTMQGLNNEVPFFICPYPARDAVAMQDLVGQLERKLTTTNGIQVLSIHLYDLALELLQKRGLLDRILEMEPTLPRDQLLELLQSVLDAETHIVPAIAEKMAQTTFDVMFISGVGEVFPYIRSHTILNNLQSTAKSQPTVLFFPGEYRHSLDAGASLDLFGILQDDKYYRAIDITHVEV